MTVGTLVPQEPLPGGGSISKWRNIVGMWDGHGDVGGGSV